MPPRWPRAGSRSSESIWPAAPPPDWSAWAPPWSGPSLPLQAHSESARYTIILMFCLGFGARSGGRRLSPSTRSCMIGVSSGLFWDGFEHGGFHARSEEGFPEVGEEIDPPRKASEESRVPEEEHAAEEERDAQARRAQGRPPPDAGPAIRSCGATARRRVHSERDRNEEPPLRLHHARHRRGEAFLRRASRLQEPRARPAVQLPLGPDREHVQPRLHAADAGHGRGKPPQGADALLHGGRRR